MLFPIYLRLYFSLLQNLFRKNGNAILCHILIILKNLLPFDIALNSSSSLSQPNLKPLPKKQQCNHPLHSKLPIQHLDKTIQVVEREKEIKAKAEDKLLRRKQKDCEKELIDFVVGKKNSRFLGKSLDSYFFPQARKIKEI